MRRPAVILSTLAAAAALVVSLGPAGAPSARPAGSSAAQNGDLRTQLSNILADPTEVGSHYSLDVFDADAGTTLYAVNQSDRLLPASNLKLYTSTTAMDVLGPGYRWRTTVSSTGRRSGKTLVGNLFLKGYGDPTSSAADYDSMAAAVARSGITRVTGSLVADDTYFDKQRLGDFWGWDGEPYYYSAQTDALTVVPNTDLDSGTIIVSIAPGKHVGDPARLTTIPANHYVHIVNHAVTGAASAPDTADAARDSEDGGNRIDVTGTIPLGAEPERAQTTVDEPEGLAADLFRTALAKHGVVVSTPTRYAATPSGATLLTTHHSITLSQLLTPFLKLSNNMHAEAIAKTLGAVTTGKQGTWPRGVDAVRADVAKNGVDTSQIKFYDGSGLSRADDVTTEQTVTLLRSVRSKPWFATWYEALPIGGDPDRLVGGTLDTRFAGTKAAHNVHAKTGSVTGVSSLSGYLTDSHGHHLVFSMFSNNVIRGDIKKTEDKVVIALAGH